MVISYAWLHPAPKGICLLAYSEGNHQLKSPKFVDNGPIFTIESSNLRTFSSENWYSDCKVIVKTFSDLAGGIMTLILIAECSFWLCKAKN